MTAADRDKLRIFAGSGGKPLAENMAQHLNLRVSSGSSERFPDGEVIVRVQEDVRGRDCFVVQSTCEPVNDRLVELLVWIDCLRRASARRITAVVPYFGYARQDRIPTHGAALREVRFDGVFEGIGHERVAPLRQVMAELSTQ